mmetsp:Transcript_6526/g.16209  ORF Transcript_6526/g.16209 Transcript_6526/m.16209 type:complete len:237 (-) Transcript_6526:857-1567(-)
MVMDVSATLVASTILRAPAGGGLKPSLCSSRVRMECRGTTHMPSTTRGGGSTVWSTAAAEALRPFASRALPPAPLAAGRRLRDPERRLDALPPASASTSHPSCATAAAASNAACFARASAASASALAVRAASAAASTWAHAASEPSHARSSSCNCSCVSPPLGRKVTVASSICLLLCSSCFRCSRIHLALYALCIGCTRVRPPQHCLHLFRCSICRLPGSLSRLLRFPCPSLGGAC